MIVIRNMDEQIKNKVREIQSKYCGESVETKLYYAIKDIIIEKQRMKTILSIFYDSGKNPSKERFKEMFKYYWEELDGLKKFNRKG